MQRFAIVCLLGSMFLAGDCRPAPAADEPAYTRKEDVVYGRVYGTALTMDVFTPKQNANGAAIIMAVSGGWYSAHDMINVRWAEMFTKRGYTVLAVCHGSNPKYAIPEILEQMHRAVRFIRAHAPDYGIDPERIGITGSSAGGHLSLMQGTAGNAGDSKAKDPIERASSRVQAVACFFPPTDFLNYGKPGEIALGCGILKDFHPPFAFQELDKKGGWAGAMVPITDVGKILQIGRHISPVNHVTSDDPPTLIIHGDKDFLVPFQQAEIIIAKLKEAGVPAELVVKPGAGHGWKDMDNDLGTLADWFDRYLKKK